MQMKFLFLQKKLLGFDRNQDGKISKREFRKFLKENKDSFGKNVKIKLDSVADLFNLSIASSAPSKSENVSPLMQSFFMSFDFADKEDELKDSTIEFIQSEYTNGLALLDGYDEGLVSKGYNSIKEFLGSNLSRSSVARALYVQNENAEFLRLAKNGELTFEEYYLGIKDTLFNTFPDVQNMSDAAKQKLKQYIDGLEPQQVKRLQNQILELPNKDAPDYKEKVDEFFTNFQAEAVETVSNTEYSDEFGMKFTSEQQAKPPYEIEDGDRLMTFEEVFKGSYGVEYNSENFNILSSVRNKYLMISATYANTAKIHELLDDVIVLNEGNLAAGVSPEIDARAMQRLETSLCLSLGTLGAESDNDKSELLCEMCGVDDIEVKDGKIVFANDSASKIQKPMTSMFLTSIAKKFLSSVDKNVEENCGTTPEEYAAVLLNNYHNVFGRDSTENLVNAFIQDQENGVSVLRRGVELTGTAAMIVGMFTCPAVALGGGMVASLGGVAVEGVNEMGKKEFSAEKKEELLKELASNVALFASGGVAGSVGNMAKAALIAKKCPRLVAAIADVGLDSTLSLVSDFVITGQISLEGEGFSQAVSLLAGHLKKFLKGGRILSRQDLSVNKNPAFKRSVNYLAEENPKVYEDFQLLRSKNLLPDSKFGDILSNPDARFSKAFLKDVEIMADAVRNNIKPIDAFVPKYKSIDEAINFRKPGEAFSIDGSNDVYIMDSTKPVKLDMDRDMYFNLFPPLKSSAFAQDAVGDCYFVGGFLAPSMANPNAKAMLLSKFHQDGNDIIFDVGGYSQQLSNLDKVVVDPELYDTLPTSIVFKNAKKRSSKLSNKSVVAPEGLKIVEEAYSYKISAKQILNYMVKNSFSDADKNKMLQELEKVFTLDDYKCSKDFINLVAAVYRQPTDIWDIKTPGKLKSNIMAQIDGIQALNIRVLGRGGRAFYPLASLYDLTPSAYSSVKSIDELLAGNYLQNPNCLITAGTEGDPHSVITQLKILFGVTEQGKKELMSGHQFMIDNIDVKNKTVGVVNPWNASNVVTLSFDSFNKYFGGKFEVVDVSKTVKNSLTKDLLDKVAQVGIKDKAPNGRLYNNSELLDKYFDYLKTEKGVEFADVQRFYVDDEVIYEHLMDNPLVKTLSDKLESGQYPVYLSSLGRLGEDVGIEKACNIITSFVAKEASIGKNIVAALLSCYKAPADYLFTLQHAENITLKLKDKGYNDSEIISILYNLTQDNYNAMKEFWD